MDGVVLGRLYQLLSNNWNNYWDFHTGRFISFEIYGKPAGRKVLLRLNVFEII